MNKRGFTLLELLAVVAIVAVVSIGAVISFGNIEDETSVEELTNKYSEIQRAANLYLDLHSNEIDWFLENGKSYFKVGDLKNENYITSDLSNPVTGEQISTDLYVMIYVSGNITDSNQTVKTCIVERSVSGDVCVANHLGQFEQYMGSNPSTDCCE